ncbi:hypothetical protein BGZ68_003185, partial [Mortierella alpina]
TVDDQETAGSKPAVQWEAFYERVNGMASKITTLQSVIKCRLEVAEELQAPSNDVLKIDGDASGTLTLLVFDAKILLETCR